MRVHRLALKLALVAAAAVAGLALGGRLLGAGLPVWGMAIGTVLLGATVYAAAYRLAARRLDTVHRMLQKIRRHEFEQLADAEEKISRKEAFRENASPKQTSQEPTSREDELDALAEEAHRTGRTLGEEFRELRKMENYRREFIGNVSHELKTPIFSIQGFAETLLDGALDDERVRRSFVEKILRNADRLRHLARDLAEIARIETGELEMTVAPFALRPLVQEVAESLEPVAAEKDVALQEHLPDDLPSVEGDHERIRQVLTNLVDNAIKYNEEGGTVEVTARELPSGAVKIYVVDDGIGVAPDHIDRLTERFYRVDQSRSRSQGGTGLGLAIVKHILGAHDSKLSVSSSPGHGSTFSFTLPAATEEADVRKQGEEREKEGLEEGERENGSAGAWENGSAGEREKAER